MLVNPSAMKLPPIPLSWIPASSVARFSVEGLPLGLRKLGLRETTPWQLDDTVKQENQFPVEEVDNWASPQLASRPP